jgi:hypothetical protein
MAPRHMIAKILPDISSAPTPRSEEIKLVAILNVSYYLTNQFWDVRKTDFSEDGLHLC